MFLEDDGVTPRLDQRSHVSPSSLHSALREGHEPFVIYTAKVLWVAPRKCASRAAMA